MGKIITFFKGPGLFIILLAALLTGAYFLRKHREAVAKEQAATVRRDQTAKTVGHPHPENRTVDPANPSLRERVAGNDLVPANSSSMATPAPASAPANPPPQAVVAKQAVKLPKMIQTYAAPKEKRPDPAPPTLFAPSGTMIKCSLVLTVDSSSLQTPVLAFVTEDVWEKKRIIIPAGTLVYAFASKGHMRDRIDVTGNWDFVFKDGREYRLAGIALDREMDTKNGGFGITDGSAGIKGQIIESDEYADLKVFLATAIGAVANNSLQTTNQGFGNSVTSNPSNIPLQGAQAVLDRYARRIEQSQEGDGTFVRIAAGTEFYIFPTKVIEPGLASVAALKQGNGSENSWELEQDKYNAAHADELQKRSPAAADAPGALLEEAAKQREAILQQSQTLLEQQRRLNNDSPYPTNPLFISPGR